MNNFRYGNPLDVIGQQGRPTCFGKVGAFDEMTRECRACPHQTDCKSTIYAMDSMKRPTAPPQQPAPVVSYAPTSTAPYAAPVPGPTQAMMPAPTPNQVPAPSFLRPAAPQQPAPVLPQPPQHLAPAPPRQPPTIYPVDPDPFRFGWLNDPMHTHGRMMPVPIRPQFEGETFVERTFKNMLLGGAEAAALELVLAIRQAVLPPKK